MSVEQDLERIAAQETALVFEKFDVDTAWALGSQLRELLIARGLVATIQIDLAGHLVFHALTKGGVPGHADWLRRKKNTVMRFHRSTYGVGRSLDKDGTSLLEKHGLPFSDYVAHGGGFPIRIKDVGVVGFIGISGLPQRDDHKIIIDALKSFLGVDVEQLD